MYDTLKDVPSGWYNKNDKSFYEINSVGALWTAEIDESIQNSDNIVVQPSLLIFSDMVNPFRLKFGEPAAFPPEDGLFPIRCSKSSNEQSRAIERPLFSQDIHDYSF